MLQQIRKIKLGDVLKRENNNYDAIRLLAAITVIISHAFYLFKGSEIISFVTFSTPSGNTLGDLAVGVFFFLSGIFITASFIKSQNSATYIISRLFRIWPALIVCVILTVFVIGLSVSTYSVKEYFGDRGSWDYLMHGILLYHLRYHLPGVFHSNFYPLAVNGSLWTLPIEMTCYLMIYILGVIGSLKNIRATIIFYAVILTLYYFDFYHLKYFLGNPFPYFIFGSLCYYFRQHIIIDYRVLAALAIMCFFLNNPILYYITFLYGIILIGASETFKRVHLPGDYSYGIYIYGFVIQQLIANYYPNLQPVKSIFVTLPVIVLLSVLSWHLIELPAINTGKKMALKLNKNIT